MKRYVTDSDISEPFTEEAGGVDWLSRFHSANSVAVLRGDIRSAGKEGYLFTVHPEKSIWKHEIKLICDAVVQDIEIC